MKVLVVEDQLKMASLLRRALRGARAVIANSERTRRDLLEQLRLPAHRVHTVYPGSDAIEGPST